MEENLIINYEKIMKLEDSNKSLIMNQLDVLCADTGRYSMRYKNMVLKSLIRDKYLLTESDIRDIKIEKLIEHDK